MNVSDESAGQTGTDNNDDTPDVIRVDDPDNYAKTRKLKALNDAKEHVRKLRNKRPPTAESDMWKGIRARTGEAVATYGSELLPLLEEAEATGVIDEEDYYNRGDVDVRDFIIYDGRFEKSDGEIEYGGLTQVMAVYRHLLRLERRLGLGLQLELDENTEWEI